MMNSYIRLPGQPHGAYPLAVADRCIIPNVNPEAIRAYRESHNAGRIRELYHIPPNAVVLLCVSISPMADISAVFLQAGIKLLQEYESAHIVFVTNVHTMEEQRHIDLLMYHAWVDGVRQRVHAYCNTPDVHPLFAAADFYVAPEFSADQERCMAMAHAFDLPVVLSSGESIADTMMRCLADTDAIEAHRNIRIATHFPRASDNSDGVSIIMRASRADTAIEAARAALATFPSYRECIVAASPSLPSDVRSALERIPRSVIVNGTDDREQVGDLHYRLLDTARGTWIANTDDDDLWVYAPDLSRIEHDIGLIHGHHLYLNMYHPPAHPEYIALEKGRPLREPSDANGVSGSSWLMRRAAWQSISPLMTDRTFNHSDWRMYYTLIKAGWKTLYVPRTMGIVRRFSYDFPEGYRWSDTHERLQAIENSGLTLPKNR